MLCFHLNIITDGIQITWSRVVLSSALGSREADAVVSEVELGVEASNENVSENPERTQRCGNIESNEPAQTDSGSSLLHLETRGTSQKVVT